MDINLDFARLLLEGDQLARADRLDEAGVIYRNLASLAADNAERALADARLARLNEASADAKSVQVVERSPVEAAPSEEARAEALANGGDIAGAIAVYQQVVAADPSNALASERLEELRGQQPAATPAVAPEVAEAVAGQVAQAVRESVRELAFDAGDLPQDPVEMLQVLLERIQANRRAVA